MQEPQEVYNHDANNERTMAVERPLNPIRRALLTTMTAVVILLAYLLIACAFLALAILIGILLVLLIPAARVWMAGSVARSIGRQWRLARLLAGALKIERGSDYGIDLNRDEAPGLFEVASRMAAAVGT